jgi:FtsP/CotA-like multicopper oxidase with cupredoxin domain
MLTLLVSLLFSVVLPATAADVKEHDAELIKQKQQHRVTNEQRKAAAERLKAQQTVNKLAAPTFGAAGIAGPNPTITINKMDPMPEGGDVPDFFGTPNWTNSPIIRKFVDALPGLGPTKANGLGQYLPIAVADKTTYPDTDYYEIGLVQYKEKMHSDLPRTLLRGYVQLNDPANPVTRDADGKIITWPKPHYLGPVIIAEKDRPVRIKFTNLLPTGEKGDLFLPVDTSMMGAGMGPLGMNPPVGGMNYTQNRATLHLHGGNTPWISDGTPHQWITPAGEVTSYPKGVSVSNVPDMPDPGDGSQTFFYSNQQSARLMFYHDHAYGITRLNVYAGEAAGYLITDAVEKDLVDRGIIPSEQIPLIIQDKTFVDADKIPSTDPLWKWGSMPGMPMTGDLWYPHVYMPNQNPWDEEGIAPFGRWDYGPWFWPPWPVRQGPQPLDPENPTGPHRPGVPNVSMTMEAFMDTPLVNGTAYPYLEVLPKAYRFRILNAANDRFFNLQLYVADPAVTASDGRKNTEVKMVEFDKRIVWPAGYPTIDLRDGGIPDPTLAGPKMIQIATEGGFLPAPVVHQNIPIGFDRDAKSMTVGNVKEHNVFLGCAERADVIIDFSAFRGKTIILYNDAPAACPASDSRVDYYTDNGDHTDTGGAPSTEAGFGPNTRTIMQFRVADVDPADPYDLAALNDAFATTADHQGVFARGQHPIIVPQFGYNSAYHASLPKDRTAYVRIQDNSLTFTPLGATEPLTLYFKPKAIAEEFEDEYGRMSGFLGVEVPFTNGMNQTTIFYGYMDPTTEEITDSMTPMSPVLGDGTQIWKITHNGVDTHPVHFHLFDVQLINRVDWAGVVKPPEPNELGWKDTVRMNPLEDCIVALRPVAPKLPFGIPTSKRALDPTMPLGTTTQFKGVNTDGNPVTVVNRVRDFGWEYVWHCHILSHEEMDMMRPVKFNVATTVPDTPTGVAMSPAGVLSWTDLTPAATSLGNPKNEIGFRIERSVNGGPFEPLMNALANATAIVDPTMLPATEYAYRVVAYNASGDAPASATVNWPTAPSSLTNVTAVMASLSSSTATISFTSAAQDGGSAITGYRVTANPGGKTVTGVASPITITVPGGANYTFTVQAINKYGASAPSAASNVVSFMNLTISIPSPGPSPATSLAAVVGTPVTLTATYPGDAAQDYKFYALYRDASNVLRQEMIRDYSEVNSVSWTPTLKVNYTVVACIRAQGEANAYDQYRAVSIIGKDPLSNVLFTASLTAPSAVGAPVKLTAAATGGGTLEYQFFATYQDINGDTQTVDIQPYAIGKSTVIWTPALPATYTLYCNVREKGSPNAFDIQQTITPYVVTIPVNTLSLTVSKKSPLNQGDTVQLTATATNGGTLEYRFYALYRDAGNVLQTEAIHEYAAGNTVNWTPARATVYTIVALVREKGKTNTYDQYSAIYNYVVK